MPIKTMAVAKKIGLVFCSLIAATTATNLLNTVKQDNVNLDQEILLTDNMLKQNEYHKINLENNTYYSEVTEYKNMKYYSSEDLIYTYYITSLELNSNETYELSVVLNDNTVTTVTSTYFTAYLEFYDMNDNKLFVSFDGALSTNEWSSVQDFNYNFKLTDSKITKLENYEAIKIRPVIGFSNGYSGKLESMFSENVEFKVALQRADDRMYTLDELNSCDVNSLNQYITLKELYDLIDAVENEAEKEKLEDLIPDNVPKEETRPNYFLCILIGIALIALIVGIINLIKKKKRF